MFIRKITICNLFAYYGKNTVEFQPQAGRPIYAIYGNNGFGKTSFIRAVKLLFLGTGLLNDDNVPLPISRFAKGKNISSKNIILGFNDYSGILNTTALNEGASEYFISFEGENGEDRFSIKRSWAGSSRNWREQLELMYRDDTYTDDDAQYMLNLMLAPEFVEFFFFDGEELGELSENLRGKLREKIEGILQISPLNLIIDQIEKHKDELRNAAFHSQIQQQQLESYNKKHEEQELTIKHNRENAKDLEAEIKDKSEQITQLIRQKESISSKYDKEFDKANDEKNRLVDERDRIKDELKNSLKSVIFMANEEVIKDLQNEFETLENSPQKDDIIILKRLIPELKELANSEIEALFNNPNAENLSKLKDIFSKILETLPKKLEAKNHPDSMISLSLIPKLRESIIRLENNHLSDNVASLKRIKKDIEISKAQLDEMQQGYDESIQNKLIQLDTKLGFLERDKESKIIAKNEADENLKNAEMEKERIEKDIDRLRQQIKDERLDQQEAILNALKISIIDYKQKLINTYQQELGKKILEYYKMLLPNDNVCGIDISPDFEIMPKNEQGEAIIVESQSSGQKQILAIAIFWALSEMSNSSIPLIIDTPLARIDAQNRAHIIQNYYVKSTNQVIILPTNTEISRTEYDYTKPYLATIYKIHNTNDRKHASIKPATIDEILYKE